MAGGAPAPGAAPSLIGASLMGQCPKCGERTLFAGLVRLAPSCAKCRLDFDAFNIGDGPAAFLILIVGAIVSVSAIVLDQAAHPAWWLHLVWLPVGLGLTLYGLRLGKAALLFQEYRHRAREGRIVR